MVAAQSETLFSLANRLCKQYDLIGVGDYAPAQGDLGLGMISWRQRESNRVARGYGHSGGIRFRRRNPRGIAQESGDHSRNGGGVAVYGFTTFRSTRTSSLVLKVRM